FGKLSEPLRDLFTLQYKHQTCKSLFRFLRREMEEHIELCKEQLPSQAHENVNTEPKCIWCDYCTPWCAYCQLATHEIEYCPIGTCCKCFNRGSHHWSSCKEPIIDL